MAIYDDAIAFPVGGYKAKHSHGQPGPHAVSENSYFGAKPIKSLEKYNFGPLYDDYSKMWPSSRFGLAMADRTY